MSRFRRNVARSAGVAAATLFLLLHVVLVASPASADPAPGSNLLVNGNFGTGFVNGHTPPDWTLTDLGAETNPYDASIDTDNASGPYAPPAGGPDPEGVADEAFYEAGSATGVEGMGGEQTSSTFGSITQADDPQVSYSVAATDSPEATNSAWAGSAFEVNFTSYPVNYTLVYYYPWQAYDSSFAGTPTDTPTVKYIIGPTLNTGSWYTQPPRDLESDIESTFGLNSFTVTSVVFADLEDTINAAQSPYPNMDGYWADIAVDEGGGGPVQTPPQLSTLTVTPPAADGGLYNPEGVAAAGGTVYISNTKDNVVLAVSGGNTTIVAGSYEGYGETGDGGPAVDATLYQPVGLAFDPTTKDLFIADTGDNVVREINTSTGVITLFAGDGTAGDRGNGGAATSAELDQPQGLAVDGDGDVFITDADNNEVREVTPDGIIHDFAGDGTAGYTGDGGRAASAELDQPSGVAVDIQGNVYIADSSNNAIRRVDATTGDITTVAGDTTAGYTGDGGLATSAELDDPQGIAIDPDGDVFVEDTFNNSVRQVSPGDQITTVVNSGLLSAPYALAVDDSTGNLYIANTSDSYVLESAGLGSISSPGPGPLGLDLAPPALAESPGTTVALPLAAAALLIGVGWFVTRRRRSVRRAA
jgi:hypothetical protein